MANAVAADRVGDVAAGQALEVAYRFLGRWHDGFTRSARDELAHEAALLALDRRHTLREPKKFPAFVRTIARRIRSHAARETLKRGDLSLDRADTVSEALAQPEQDSVLLRVRDTLVERDVLLGELNRMLAKLTVMNRRILLSYYEGFSCAELAARFEMPEESIKVRIHRARGKLRQLLEQRVCSRTGEFRTGSWGPGSTRDPVSAKRKHEETTP